MFDDSHSRLRQLVRPDEQERLDFLRDVAERLERPPLWLRIPPAPVAFLAMAAMAVGLLARASDATMGAIFAGTGAVCVWFVLFVAGRLRWLKQSLEALRCYRAYCQVLARKHPFTDRW